MAASGLGESSERNVVPRWRQSSSFASSPEADASRSSGASRQIQSKEWSEAAFLQWTTSPTVGYLADAFSAAVVEQNQARIGPLAEAVQREGDRVSVPLQQIAATQLSAGRGEFDTDFTSIAALDRFADSITERFASQLRKRCQKEPRNAFHWHDLSYALNLLGDSLGAESAMRAALQVSESHRLIVRSAARLFLHLGGRREALKVIERARSPSTDPWLLSAHLAISQGGDRASKFSSQARSLLEGRKSLGLQYSELGMAVATQEVMSGRSKKAKQLISSSSQSPTENALAQGVWLSHQLRIPADTTRLDKTRGAAFEAQSWSSFYAGEWVEATRATIGWLIDEPFSKRPAMQGSFIASTFLRDHVLGERIARFGLKMNPEDWGLKNNLAVALAEQDRLVEASTVFDAMSEPAISHENYPVHCATAGLLAYRIGDIESGRALYQRAMDELSRTKNRTSQLVLTIYQSLEELRLANTVEARKLLARLPASARSTQDKEGLFSKVLEIELGRTLGLLTVGDRKDEEAE